MENDIKAGNQPKQDHNKYFLIFFHLFESVVNNTSRLMDRYSQHLVSQCPKEVVKMIETEDEKSAKKESASKKAAEKAAKEKLA